MRELRAIFLGGVLLPLVGQAQKVNNDMVWPGPKGIIVLTGEQLMRAAGPVTGMRIERRMGEQGDWKEVADLEPVGSTRDIEKGLDRAATVLPYPIDLQGHRTDSIWARVHRHGTREQLGAMNGNMAVLLAVGAAWCDTDVRSGSRYQYRVSLAGSGNQLLTQFIDPAERPPVDKLMPHHTRYYEHQHTLNGFWVVTGEHRPAVIEVRRSMDADPFEVITPTLRIERGSGDTLWYQFGDTTAVKNRVYRYVLIGWDLTGNPMPPCDTLYTASLDASQMPMPYDLHAVGDSSGRRINIRWQLDNAPLVKQVTLLRSTNSVDGFMPVAELSADRTNYVDEDVRPATPYFYRFTLEHKATHVPMRGVSFAAVAYDPLPPAAPQDLMAEATATGVRLTWSHPAVEMLGFHIYRADDAGPAMLASSRTTVANDGSHAYEDTAKGLVAGHTYRYHVRAISTSHKEGHASDTVAVVPFVNAPLPTAPRGLTVNVDGELATVLWDDQSGEPLWQSYIVVRMRSGNRMDTVYRATNFLIDTLDAAGTTTSYRIISTNAFNKSSVPTPSISARAHVRVPSPPSGLVANMHEGTVKLTWDVLLDEAVQRFDVYRYTRGNEPVKLGSVAGGKPSRFEDASPASGALNFYFVRSVAATGAESGPSREVGVGL